MTVEVTTGKRRKIHKANRRTLRPVCGQYFSKGYTMSVDNVTTCARCAAKEVRAALLELEGIA